MSESQRDWGELPGEDLTTSAIPEVAGWISIYEELVSVLRSVIARAAGGFPGPAIQARLGRRPAGRMA